MHKEGVLNLFSNDKSIIFRLKFTFIKCAQRTRTALCSFAADAHTTVSTLRRGEMNKLPAWKYVCVAPTYFKCRRVNTIQRQQPTAKSTEGNIVNNNRKLQFSDIDTQYYISILFVRKNSDECEKNFETIVRIPMLHAQIACSKPKR